MDIGDDEEAAATFVCGGIRSAFITDLDTATERMALRRFQVSKDRGPTTEEWRSIKAACRPIDALLRRPPPTSNGDR